MAGSLNKKYGLIVPKKAQQQQPTLQSKLSAFADDSDEESPGLGPMTSALFKVGSKTVVKKKTQDAMNKALAEDPTVYEYDSIYEKLEQQKEELTNKQPQKTEKKARYIGGLLKAAEVRKKELELRNERKIQKEREAEGEEFADKEAFVTSSYRKKMEEMQNELQKQKKEDEMEALLDVTKQKDMSGFYRHLFRQQLGEPSASTTETSKEEPTGNEIKIKKENSEQTEKPSVKADEDADTSLSSDESDEENNKNKTVQSKKLVVKNVKSRNYRRRSSSSGDDMKTSEVSREQERRKDDLKKQKVYRKQMNDSDSSSGDEKEKRLHVTNRKTNDSDSSSSENEEEKKRLAKGHTRFHGEKKLPESSSKIIVESNNNSNNESRKVENVERAQKKRRHDSSCSDDDNQAERKKKESEDSVNKNVKDKFEQEREEVEKRRSVFARRNFEEEINAARERYFARIQAKLLVVKNLTETTAA